MDQCLPKELLLILSRNQRAKMKDKISGMNGGLLFVTSATLNKNLRVIFIDKFY